MVSFVQGNVNAGASGTTNPVAYTAANTAGNLLLVVASWFGATTTAVASDSRGNVWTAAPVQAGSAGCLAVFWAPGCIAGANTVTVTLGASRSFFDAEVAEYSGLVGIDGTNYAAATASSSNANSGPLTATANPTFLIGAGRCDSSGGFTAAGTGFTQRVNNDGTSWLEDKLITVVPSSQQATFVMNNGPGNWIVYALAFTVVPPPPLPPPIPVQSGQPGLTLVIQSHFRAMRALEHQPAPAPDFVPPVWPH